MKKDSSKSKSFGIMIGLLLSIPSLVHHSNSTETKPIIRKPWQNQLSEKKRELLIKELQTQNADASEIQALNELPVEEVDDFYKEFKESTMTKNSSDRMSIDSLSEEDINNLSDEQIDQIVKKDEAKKARVAAINSYLKQTKYKDLETLKAKTQAQKGNMPNWRAKAEAAKKAEAEKQTTTAPQEKIPSIVEEEEIVVLPMPQRPKPPAMSPSQKRLMDQQEAEDAKKVTTAPQKKVPAIVDEEEIVDFPMPQRPKPLAMSPTQKRLMDQLAAEDAKKATTAPQEKAPAIVKEQEIVDFPMPQS